jgi:multicomponent Na+:H+ antiporter subunit E
MQGWLILGLWVIYLGLTANLELSNVVLGLLIALGLTALLHPSPRRIALRNLPDAMWASLQYTWIVVIDMFRGGLLVARITLDPALPIQPGIIAIAAGTDSELATALSADAITLSPGELVVEIDEHGVMYTHALDVTKAVGYVDEAQRQRREILARILP